jgi:hypothetical protein
MKKFLYLVGGIALALLTVLIWYFAIVGFWAVWHG